MSAGSSRKRETIRAHNPEVQALVSEPAPAAPAPRDRSAIEERVRELRDLLYEAEKHCQFLSSAVNTPDLPAGCWIYVDALRMGVLASMRNAQLVELKVRELMPDPPPADEHT